MDAKLASVHAGLFRETLQEQRNRGWWPGRTNSDEPCTIELIGFVRSAWTAWTNHIHGKNLVDNTNAHVDLLQQLVSAVKLGRRIDDPVFTKAAHATLTALADEDSILGPPSLVDSLLTSIGSDDIPIAACRVIAQIAVDEVRGLGNDRQTETGASRQSYEIQRLYRAYTELERNKTAERERRLSAQMELDLTRMQNVELEQKKEAKEKESSRLQVQLFKQELKYKREVERLQGLLRREVDLHMESVAGQEVDVSDAGSARYGTEDIDAMGAADQEPTASDTSSLGPMADAVSGTIAPPIASAAGEKQKRKRTKLSSDGTALTSKKRAHSPPAAARPVPSTSLANVRISSPGKAANTGGPHDVVDIIRRLQQLDEDQG